MSTIRDNVMSEGDWTSLVKSIELHNCILMLGPDATAGTYRGEYLPAHVALATYVKEQLGPDFDHLDPTQPSSVAQAAIANEDPITLQAWVGDFYEREFEGDFEVIRELAELPFEWIINTSPGFSAQSVFEEINPNTYSDYYDRTGPVRDSLPEPSPTAPIVYHLYGSLEQPASLILTMEDRLDFLVSIVSGNPPLPGRLTAALADPRRTFLFAGFDLSQWQFRMFLHVLSRDARRRNKSFAFELDPARIDQETVDFFKSSHRIHFVTGDIRDFAHDLRGRVRSEQPEPEPDEPPPLPSDAPLVFLCHANADKDVAERLARHLQSNGIDTWLDKHNLRAGDVWDDRIKDLITQQVDYVVVLQSAGLKEREVGYVNREIKLALERQDLHRYGGFVIPVIVDSITNMLPQFAGMHAPDVSRPEGITELVRTIKRDQHRGAQRP